jgi:hypothetical protein
MPLTEKVDAFDYINNFDNPALAPSRDTKDLGSMTFGSSGNVTPVPPSFDPGSGVILGVNRPGMQDTSSTVYVISETTFVNARLLVARLDFDWPQAFYIEPDADIQQSPFEGPWAVALNFKTGSAADKSNDVRYGATCQFTPAGPRITQTVERSTTFKFWSYDAYFARGIGFSLEVALHRKPFNQDAPFTSRGDATLTIDSETKTETFLGGPYPIGPKDPKITAAGVAVVAPFNGGDAENIKCSVRLKSFSLLIQA